MIRNILILSFLFVFSLISAQELKCLVKVNSEKLPAGNQQPLKSLETALNEFINKNTWTTTIYKPNERISCSMTIDIDSYESDLYSGSIQVQSSRIAYDTTYSTPIFNFNDKSFTFKYQEFEPLIFNPNGFDSNLISVIAFYSYVIIGLDQDSLSNLGGAKALDQAQTIANLAQASGYKGWSQNDGTNTRYFLINDLLSNTFGAFRETMYDYNINGIDLMEKNPKFAKEKIIESLNALKKIHSTRPNSFLMRVFFDTKGDEIVSIFSGGPKIEITSLIDNLNRISPLNNSKWNTIRN
ncbi:MAG: DUF4835 family protein [Flavobacterium sp.]|nr:DUF4835 family protein [Flavobacterium sp.]